MLITGLRLAISNPIEAPGFLYVIPISLLASEGSYAARTAGGGPIDAGPVVA